MIQEPCQRLVTRLQPKRCPNTTDFALCFDCVKLLGDTIKGLKEYSDELETQITRQDKGAPSVGGGSGEPRLVWDLDSSQARDHIYQVLSHRFAENTNPEVHPHLQGLTIEVRIRKLLAWFRVYYVYLGRSDKGPQILADLDDALDRARRAVDRKQDKVWIGNCDCGKPVVAFPKQQADVQCECGREWNPQRSRRDLRVMGGNEIVTIRQAQTLGEVWGRRINAVTVRSWLRREKIHCQGDCTEDSHEHTFRMADILALHKES